MKLSLGCERKKEKGDEVVRQKKMNGKMCPFIFGHAVRGPDDVTGKPFCPRSKGSHTPKNSHLGKEIHSSKGDTGADGVDL